MRTYFTVLMMSAVTAFLLTPLIRRLAFSMGAVDVPDLRKVHLGIMPRMGGVAVFLAFCLPWVALYLQGNPVAEAFREYEKVLLVLLVSATFILILGIYDDIKSAQALVKLLFQIIIAVMLYFGGFQIRQLSNPFGEPFQLGWLSLPVSVLWIVGITNAINLLDGIDGLVAGVTACISLSLAIINILGGNILVALLTLGLAGACLGFLPYNFSPARIFLGDSGSLFIGLTLSCIGILSLFKAATASFILVPLILFGLPLFDTTSVVIMRARRGQSIFSPDKSHVHHRLLRLGLDHGQAAYFLYLVTATLGLLAILLSWQQSVEILLGGGAVVMIVALAIGLTWRIRVRRLTSMPPDAISHDEESPPTDSPEEDRCSAPNVSHSAEEASY